MINWLMVGWHHWSIEADSLIMWLNNKLISLIFQVDKNTCINNQNRSQQHQHFKSNITESSINLIKDCIIINVCIIIKLCPTSTSLTSTRFLNTAKCIWLEVECCHWFTRKYKKQTIFRRKDYRHWKGPWFVVLFRCLTASHSTHFSAAPSVQFFCPESIPVFIVSKTAFSHKIK